MISIKEETIIFAMPVKFQEIKSFNYKYISVNAIFAGGIGYFGDLYFTFKNFEKFCYSAKREVI